MSRKSRSSIPPSSRKSGVDRTSSSASAMQRAALAVLAATQSQRLIAYLRRPDQGKLFLEADCWQLGEKQVSAVAELDASDLETIFWQVTLSEDCVALSSKDDAFRKLAVIFTGRPFPVQVWLFPIWDVNVLQGWLSLEFEKRTKRVPLGTKDAVMPMLNILGDILRANQGGLSGIEGLTSLLDATSEGVIVASAGSLRLHHVNAAARSALMLPNAVNLSGLQLLDFKPARSAAAWKKMLDELEHQRVWSGNIPLLSAGKQRFTAAAFGFLFRHSLADGSSALALIFNTKDETRLRETRDQEASLHETLVKNTSACIVVTDPVGTVSYINPAVEELTGYPAEHFIGKRIAETGTVNIDDLNTLGRTWCVELPRGSPVRGSMRVLTQAGEVRIIETHSATVKRPDGGRLCVVTTATDVTEHRRVEAQVVKVAEEVQMRIGHDLHDGVGQVLTGVISLTEALEARLDGTYRLDAARIRELAKEAIKQVRDMSHSLSASALKQQGLSEALRLLASQVRHQHLECDVEIESEPKIEDPEKEAHLFRIAQEAVNNAIKHGKPRRISLFLKRGVNGRCLMRIENDGISINPEKLLNNNGIGLRGMHYRADLIGGQLEIRPLVRGGTVVSCRFSCAY